MSLIMSHPGVVELCMGTLPSRYACMHVSADDACTYACMHVRINAYACTFFA